ncbi:hypothetical protein FS749_016740 [Ceratobasidium sp. UAMH 11750]|nr:hypothetical protein FS749_016740 [Ceratobasidium sp. UAMH 11750]
MASTSDARLHGSASTHPTVSGSMSGSSLVMSDTWIGFTRGLVLLTDPSIHRYAPSLVPRALILVPPKPTRHRACQVYAVWALRQPTVSVPVGDVRNPAVMSLCQVSIRVGTCCDGQPSFTSHRDANGATDIAHNKRSTRSLVIAKLGRRRFTISKTGSTHPSVI